jgi:hypothetical protein
MKPIVLSRFKLAETRHERLFYVSRVKGDGGVDWEWTQDPESAAIVTYYWVRRFMADRDACGVKTAQCVEVASA